MSAAPKCSNQELEMSTHTASQTTTAEPAHVLQVLTDPAACARWAPIEFSTDQAPGEYLHAGGRTRLQGRIAGRKVTFEIDVLAADERGLSLRATGPVRLAVDYQLTPSGRGTLIEAQITLTQAGGMTGALASRATNAILGAGALRFALRAIAAEAEQLQQAGGRELASAQKRRAA
jgi:Polyketide cyclase / dehydrase and lipid transport